MFTVLQGQISTSEGLREALEIVLTIGDVQNGVLRITSVDVSGRIGIFCGRYVTGAMTGSGESGNLALRKLLSVKSGNFAFLDAKGEKTADLQQSLSLDLGSLIELVPDGLEAQAPLLEESLAGLRQPGEQLFLVDTSFGDSDPDFQFDYQSHFGLTQAGETGQAPQSLPFEEAGGGASLASRSDQPIAPEGDFHNVFDFSPGLDTQAVAPGQFKRTAQEAVRQSDSPPRSALASGEPLEPTASLETAGSTSDAYATLEAQPEPETSATAVESDPNSQFEQRAPVLIQGSGIKAGSLPPTYKVSTAMARQGFQKTRQIGKRANNLTVPLILLAAFVLACLLTVLFGQHLFFHPK